MKKLILFLLTAAMMSCGGKTTATAEAVDSLDTVAHADSTVEQFDSLKIEIDSMAISLVLTVDTLPTDANVAKGLAQFVACQLFFPDEDGKTVQPEYMGNLQEFLRACALQKWEELKVGTFNNDDADGDAPTPEELANQRDADGEKIYLTVGTIDLKKAYETDELVTYTSDCQYTFGGITPTFSASGVTLRKADGKVMGRELLKDTQSAAFRQQLKKAVAEWVKVNFEMPIESDDDLQNVVAEPHQVNNLPLPERNPYLVKGGVVLPYQGYELLSTPEPQLIGPLPTSRN